MKIIILILTLTFTISAQEVKTNYDKFKDRTFVTFDKGRAVQNKRKSYWLWVYAGFNYSGTQLTDNVNKFLVAFTGVGGSWQFLTSRDLIILVDGKSYKFGEGKRDSEIKGGYSGMVSETISYVFSRDQIEAVATAKKVELQLGGFEGYFDDKTIARFKELLALSTKH